METVIKEEKKEKEISFDIDKIVSKKVYFPFFVLGWTKEDLETLKKLGKL